MKINITYDTSVNSAPAEFKTAVQTAVAIFESTFTNPVTLNIGVGFGEVAGTALSGGSLGQSSGLYTSINYANLRTRLGDARLPAADPTNGAGFIIANAEAKIFGLGSNLPLDGSIGLSSSAALFYDQTNPQPGA